MMIVRKFGGTSVGSPSGMSNILDLINIESKKQFIVFSALSGVTNLLDAYCNSNVESKRAKLLNEILERHLDQISGLYLSHDAELVQLIKDQMLTIEKLGNNLDLHKAEIMVQGELLSIAIFSCLLFDQGIGHKVLKASFFIEVDAFNIPIIKVDSSLISEFDHHDLILAPGFICKDSKGKIVNLGRGGSDYSASIFASRLKAERVEIWSDIDGFCQNDPRYVDTVYVLNSLSYDEASELAFFGAKLLHPLCVKPARISNIPILLKNTNNPISKGTWISSESSSREVTAVAAKDGLTAIKITSDKMIHTYGYLKDVFTIFDTHKIPVDTVSTSEVSISMTIESSENIDVLIQDLSTIGQVEKTVGLTNVCVVGDFNKTKTGIASVISDCLQHIPIQMISYGGNEHSISFLIESNDKVLALNNLQSIFNKEELCA
jgi:aspartate kinase